MYLKRATQLLKSTTLLVFAVTLVAAPVACADDKPSVRLGPKIQVDNLPSPLDPKAFKLALDPLNPALTHPEAIAMNMTAGNASVSNQQQQQFYAVAQFIVNYNQKLSWEEASRITSAILQFSQHYHVDFRLLTGLIAVESSFRSDAVSSSGAMGLGQLKPDTAKWLGVVDAFDPVDNIAGTARFLGWLLRKYNGSMDHALSAYYQGPGTVDRNGITPKCYPYLIKINNVLGRMVSNQ